MKPENKSRELLKQIVNPKKKKFRENVYVFLVCLMLSIVIWFLIALSKESYTTLEYPVQYKNLPVDMALVNDPDSILTFRIASGGFELLTLRYLTRKNPVVIDVSKIRLEENNGLFSGIYNTTRVVREIQKKQRFADEVVDITPQQIYLKFEPMTGKEVPVISNLKLEFKKQFRMSDSVVFKPAMVKVIGPRNIVDEISVVKTSDKLINNIAGGVSGRCYLRKPFSNDQLTLVPDQVEFTITAERFTEATLAIPISSIRQDVSIKTFPDKVNVTFLVSLENFKRIDPKLFSAVIDLPESTQQQTKAQVRLSRIPPFVEIVRIEPSTVEYLVVSP